MKQITVKAGQLFAVTMFGIMIFSVIYFMMSLKENREISERRNVLDSVFMSSMIQTMNGNGGFKPVSDSEKIIMSVQAIIAFFITSGIIIIGLRTI